MDGKAIVELWQISAYNRVPVWSHDMMLLVHKVDAALAHACAEKDAALQVADEMAEWLMTHPTPGGTHDVIRFVGRYREARKAAI